MWIIKTVRDSELGGFNTVVAQNDDYKMIRKEWFRLTHHHGKIFALKFNI